MDTDLDPVVGNWYRHEDKGQLFRVVAYDEAREIVEIQHFDGDLEEIEASAWFDMDIEPAEAPEDWTGPLDDVEHDDLGVSDTAMSARDWREPLEEIDADEDEWDERPGGERGDWNDGDAGDYDDSDSEDR